MIQLLLAIFKNDAGSTPQSVVGAANEITSITIPAPGAGKRIHLTHLSFYFSGANTAGVVTVESPASTVLARVAYPASQTTAREIAMGDGWEFAENVAVVVNVPAGGAGITSTLNVAHKVCDVVS